MDMPILTNRSYNETKLFPFEFSHNEDGCQRWINEHWAAGFYCAFVYLCAIFGGKLYMKNRERLDLRYPLIAWSGTLAIFSMFGIARLAPQFFEDMYDKGIHYTLCDNSFMLTKPTSFWFYVFTVSKIIELGDTLFIVARKQPLIFLHYYHHATVLLFCWYAYPQRTSPCRWSAVMNFSVHSLMYSYYTLRAMRVKVPKQVNICITVLQILQMLVGLLVNIYAAYMLNTAVTCATNLPNVRYALAMYGSYFLLFAKFFYDVYLRPKSKQN